MSTLGKTACRSLADEGSIPSRSTMKTYRFSKHLVGQNETLVVDNHQQIVNVEPLGSGFVVVIQTETKERVQRPVGAE